MAEKSGESSSSKSNDNDNGGVTILPIDLVVTELFSRLPIKSLMRCKCVSKLCFSLINHSFFVEKYQSRKRPFLVIPPSSSDYKVPHNWDRRFLMIDTNKPPKSRATVLDPTNLPYALTAVTNVVNGLVCFYHKKDLEQPIYLYNLSTRENLQLPPPLDSLPSTTDDEHFKRECRLGFDPINQQYKLLQIINPDLGQWKVACAIEGQVLTLGSKKNIAWRRIDISDVSESLIGTDGLREGPSFCVDGVLYWIDHYRFGKKIVMTFDVKLEKFKVINYPPFDQPMCPSRTLAQLRGQLSLVSIPRGGSRWDNCSRYDQDVEITVWRLLDKDDDDDDEWLWNKQVITWQFLDNDDITCSDFGLVSCVVLSSKDGIATIQGYDLATGKALKFQINNAQGVFNDTYPRLDFLPSKMIENIISLKNINGR